MNVLHHLQHIPMGTVFVLWVDNFTSINHFRMEVLRSKPKVPDSEPSPTHRWYPLITASQCKPIWSLVKELPKCLIKIS